MELKAPEESRNHLVERWLNTLSPEDREEALGYLRQPSMYGNVALRDAFRHDGFKGTEGAIAGWRDRHL